jgi:hypothetical protein
MKSFAEYLKTIVQINSLETGQAVECLFHSGMLFLSRDKWWGDFRFRSTAHEGIDICFFRSAKGKIQCFDPEIQVPALEDGRIINICNDFLGQTLVVERQEIKLAYSRVLIAYAHIQPAENIRINDNIKNNRIIAKLCDTVKNPQLPPHLHLSCFEVPKTVKPDELNWTFFSRSIHASLINPVFL